jgi:DNA-directed RNA polymerase specialized sigma24 family protein
VDETTLPAEHQGEDDAQRVVGISEDEASTVDVQAVIDQARGELGEDHRRAVDLHVFDGESARTAVTSIGNGMTEANVHQIATRFRKRMRELLNEAS